LVAEQPRLKADLVIFSVFADNDLGDLLRHRHFELQDGVLTRRDDFFIYPEPGWLERIRSSVSTLLIVRAARRLAREVGDVVGLVRMAEPIEAPATGPEDTVAYVRELSRLASDALLAYRERSPHYVRIDSYDIDVATVPESDSSKTKVTLLRAILKEAKRHAMEMDVELLVVVQPSRVDVATTAPLDHRFLSRYPNYRRDALTGLVEGLCRELRIEVLNLFPIFVANEPNELYFRDTDNHWNDRGQAVAAAAAAQRVSLLISRRRKH
jgi:hypothetical protein